MCPYKSYMIIYACAGIWFSCVIFKARPTEFSILLPEGLDGKRDFVRRSVTSSLPLTMSKKTEKTHHPNAPDASS